ncbi:MAG: choline-sulfatase, partial [Planctomycetota bacterium]|nr:choline-sulfatase [Planctomycetota bacterium]
YADGSEELYNTQKDPHEWKNLANSEELVSVKNNLRRWIPKVNRKPAPGSRHRILTHENGKTIWQGEAIEPTAKIPEID